MEIIMYIALTLLILAVLLDLFHRFDGWIGKRIQDQLSPSINGLWRAHDTTKEKLGDSLAILARALDDHLQATEKAGPNPYYKKEETENDSI